MKASGIALVASLSLLGLCPCASIRMMPKSDVEDFEDEHSDFGLFDDGDDGYGDAFDGFGDAAFGGLDGFGGGDLGAELLQALMGGGLGGGAGGGAPLVAPEENGPRLRALARVLARADDAAAAAAAGGGGDDDDDDADEDLTADEAETLDLARARRATAGGPARLSAEQALREAAMLLLEEPRHGPFAEAADATAPSAPACVAACAERGAAACELEIECLVGGEAMGEAEFSGEDSAAPTGEAAACRACADAMAAACAEAQCGVRCERDGAALAVTAAAPGDGAASCRAPTDAADAAGAAAPAARASVGDAVFVHAPRAWGVVVRLSFAHDLYEITLRGEGGAASVIILARRAHFSAVGDIARGMPAMAQ